MKILQHCYFAAILVFSMLQTVPLFSQSMEEFNGPFPSWANVKLRFGAKGNGKDDDTKAIQQAIDGLGVSGSKGGLYTVVYLPAGTYCISATLLLKGKIGITITGENPSTTVIKWTGADVATMLLGNGSAFYKISRLSWDANGRKGVEAIGVHWRDKWNDGKSQSYASLNIEISDNTFVNCKYGIGGGTNPGEGTASNDSEIAIKRCLFQNCTGAGLMTTGYNALDYWLWDCRFINCNIGINSKYGNFFAYRCYFKNSGQTDIANTNGYIKSVRGCYSEDSRTFVVDSGASQNPFKRNYQGNIVIRPKWLPIQYYHWGRLFFMDNFFDKSVDTAVHFFVKTGSNIISSGNQYRNKAPVSFTNVASFNQFNDVYPEKAFAAGAVFLESQDKIPASIKREIFEIPANADASTIQQTINAAVKLKGKKPIVHFAAGTYTINKTLQIPGGADLQLTGDGCLEATVLLPSANFPAGGALIKIEGPTNVVIRELQLGKFTNSKTGVDAIQFINTDQQNSNAFIDQIYTVGNNAIRAEAIDYLYIQKDNSFFADNDFISGGPSVQAGKGTAAIFGFGGQFAGIELQNNAKAVMKDCWWEGSMRNPVNLSGSGNLTIDGAMVAPSKSDSTTTIAIKKFKGSVNLLNSYIQGGLDVTPDNPDLKLLVLNVHFYYTLDPLKFLTSKSSFKGYFMQLTTQCFNSNDKRCNLINWMYDVANLVPAPASFVPAMLADDSKAMPRKYETKNKAASNILITRVSMGDVNNGIRFTK